MLNIFKSRPTFTSEQVHELLVDLQHLSYTNVIELKGTVHYNIGNFGFEEKATAEIKKGVFSVVIEPGETSRPGSAFWSVREYDLELTDDGVLQRKQRRECEYDVFKCAPEVLQRLFDAHSQSRLPQLVVDAAIARKPVLDMQSKVNAMFRDTIGMPVGRHHAYVYWTVEALQAADVDPQNIHQFLDKIQERLEKLCSSLSKSTANFSDSRYHKVVKRKIYEGVNAGLKLYAQTADTPSETKKSFGKLLPLLSHLKSYLKGKHEYTDEQVYNLMQALLIISKEHTIKLPGIVAEDFGSFFERERASLFIKDGLLTIVKNVSAEITEAAPLEQGTSMLAELMDDGRAVHTERWLVTDYFFTVSQKSLDLLMPIYEKGTNALREWARSQEACNNRIEEPLKTEEIFEF